MTNKNRSARNQSNAISRWDDEGGASSALVTGRSESTPAASEQPVSRESWDRVQAIWKAIDDYAELETGNREYFWNRPHSIG